MIDSTKVRKLALTALIVSGVAGVVAFGTYSAFSSTTSNPNNNFATGSVAISDNDGGTALYNVTNAKPGDSSAAKCITVTYTGSLGSTVKLYRSAFTGGSGNLDSQVDLVVTKGTGGSFADCSGFTPAASGSNVYTGKLSDFPATYAGGLSLTNTAASSSWAQNDAVTYKVQAALPAATGDSYQNTATGTHSFTWETQSN